MKRQSFSTRIVRFIVNERIQTNSTTEKAQFQH